jgi:hypothetical protein
MPVLTSRREKPAGPVISALVTAAVLGGIACSLPAFASAADSHGLSPCPPTTTSGPGSAPGSAPDSAGPTVTGTGPGSAARAADPTGSATPTGDPTGGCQTSTAAPPSGTASATASASATGSATATATTGTASATPSVTAAAPTTTIAPPTRNPTTVAAPPPPPPPVIDPTQTSPYTDTPPGDTDQTEPHGTISRAQIITRAEKWLAEQVPYSQVKWWKDSDGIYRQDCSGYVSMAWALDQNIDFWTGNLNTVSHTIDPADLLPGDTLMSIEHTIIFAGWADPQHTEFDFFEEAHPGTVARFVVDAPLTAYTDNGFNAFRYDGVIDSGVLPPDPTSGLSFASLSSGSSEIVPTGVLPTEPAPAPWQKTVPDEQALQSMLASQKAAKTPTTVNPQLAAMGMGAGPAPIRVLLAAAVLSAAFLILAMVRNPRIKPVALVRRKPRSGSYRRKH